MSNFFKCEYKDSYIEITLDEKSRLNINVFREKGLLTHIRNNFKLRKVIEKCHLNQGCSLRQTLLRESNILFIDIDNIYNKNYLRSNWVDLGNRSIDLSGLSLDFIPLIKTKGIYDLRSNKIDSIGNYKQTGPLNLRFNKIKVIPEGFNNDLLYLNISNNEVEWIPEYLIEKCLLDDEAIERVQFNYNNPELYTMEKDFS